MRPHAQRAGTITIEAFAGRDYERRFNRETFPICTSPHSMHICARQRSRSDGRALDRRTTASAGPSAVGRSVKVSTAGNGVVRPSKRASQGQQFVLWRHSAFSRRGTAACSIAAIRYAAQSLSHSGLGGRVLTTQLRHSLLSIASVSQPRTSVIRASTRRWS